MSVQTGAQAVPPDRVRPNKEEQDAQNPIQDCGLDHPPRNRNSTAVASQRDIERQAQSRIPLRTSATARSNPDHAAQRGLSDAKTPGGVAAPAGGTHKAPTSKKEFVMYQSTNGRKERRDAILDGLSVVLGFLLIIGMGWAFLTNLFGGAL